MNESISIDRNELRDGYEFYISSTDTGFTRLGRVSFDSAEMQLNAVRAGDPEAKLWEMCDRS